VCVKKLNFKESELGEDMCVCFGWRLNNVIVKRWISLFSTILVQTYDILELAHFTFGFKWLLFLSALIILLSFVLILIYLFRSLLIVKKLSNIIKVTGLISYLRDFSIKPKASKHNSNNNSISILVFFYCC